MVTAKWPWATAALSLMVTGQPAYADFTGDSHATLDLRNLYFDRDFRQPGGNTANGHSQAREWGQGATLQVQSGFTDGTVGFGLDSIAMLGLKLDSGGGRAGSGLFPSRTDGSSVDEYSKIGFTAKARVSKTVIKAGALLFRNTVLQAQDSRLLGQFFRGAMVESRELDNLSVQAARITSLVAQDSTNWDKLSSRFGGVSDHFVLAGGDYSFGPTSTVGLHYGKLEGIYQQAIFNYGGALDLTDNQALKVDLRLAKSEEDGHFRPIDNKAVGVLTSYKFGAQTFGVGYQKMIGDDAYPFVTNTDPYLVNFIQVLQFSNAGERSWQVRYDFDLAAWGIPGLSFMTRYVTGDQIKQPGVQDAREWERNTDLAYVVQSGAAKSLELKWRNATVRTNFGNDLDENRLIVSYPMRLF
ncbi:OprD family porin [Pseudomonas tolaasii]|uniref:OprD family porin n=1 Tax=Pseudomonas tolaasii TaxID=29442 RepID=UPI002734E711|nr:OprD family porin [Pseudomonas tolaasii]WLH54063.1 OprD family porin [Pseudomonas tolaasii]